MLLVEDNLVNQEVAREMLLSFGLSVTIASDGYQALKAVSSGDFDVILMDCQMPVMDGFQVMEGLKTNIEDPYLPVLVLTAQPGHKLRALQAGAKDGTRQCCIPGCNTTARSARPACRNGSTKWPYSASTQYLGGGKSRWRPPSWRS